MAGAHAAFSQGQAVSEDESSQGEGMRLSAETNVNDRKVRFLSGVTMAWNEPGGGNKDPWSGKGGDQGPPDLDEVVRKLQERLGGLFGGKKSPRDDSGNGGGGGGGGGGRGEERRGGNERRSRRSP